MNKNSPRKPPTPIEAERTTPGLEQEIRRRAYELYEQRGRVAGYELDDWLQAEAELLSVKSRKKKIARAGLSTIRHQVQFRPVFHGSGSIVHTCARGMSVGLESTTAHLGMNFNNWRSGPLFQGYSKRVTIPTSPHGGLVQTKSQVLRIFAKAGCAMKAAVGGGPDHKTTLAGWYSSSFSHAGQNALNPCGGPLALSNSDRSGVSARAITKLHRLQFTTQ